MNVPNYPMYIQIANLQCIAKSSSVCTNLGSGRDSNACSKTNVSDCSKTILSLRLSIVAAEVTAVAPQSLPVEEAAVVRLGAGDGDRSPRVTARMATFAIDMSVP